MFKNVAAASLLFLLAAAAYSAMALGRDAPLAGIVENSAQWTQFKQRFIAPSGRVVDDANGGISHSEGQGFGMILAVAANDAETFARLWRFTRDNLAIRKDSLLAWKWQPSGPRRVPDPNNATDGDVLIAWALLEAAHAGFGESYHAQGLAILDSLTKLERNNPFHGRYLAAGQYGFSPRAGQTHEIINLSYWVFPAYQRLLALTGRKAWLEYTRSGLRLLRTAARGKSGLPGDWSALGVNDGRLGKAERFDATFSYNAVRVPLYTAWLNEPDLQLLSRYHRGWASTPDALKQVDTVSGKAKGRFSGKGYEAIAAVVACAVEQKPFPDRLRGDLDTLYYPAALHVLSIIAVKQRYPRCW